MFEGGEKTEVGPELSRLGELEGVFELIAEQPAADAGIGFESDEIDLRFPPIGEGVRNGELGGITSVELGSRISILIAAQLDFRLGGLDVRRVDDEVVRLSRRAVNTSRTPNPRRPDERCANGPARGSTQGLGIALSRQRPCPRRAPRLGGLQQLHAGDQHHHGGCVKDDLDSGRTRVVADENAERLAR